MHALSLSLIYINTHTHLVHVEKRRIVAQLVLFAVKVIHKGLRAVAYHAGIQRLAQATQAREDVERVRRRTPRGVPISPQRRGMHAHEGPDGILWRQVMLQHEVRREVPSSVGDVLLLRAAVVDQRTRLQLRVVVLVSKLPARWLQP
jgi:hypothetical protein